MLLFSTLAGCAVNQPTDQWIRTELYFGLSRPTGPNISDAEFQTFLDDSVAPDFPDGFTVIDSQGRWKQQNGEIRTEPSRIIILLHNRTDDDQKINEIRRKYKARFGQESVLRVDDLENAQF